ncbi:hypothetical protein AMIS_67240 [Actinoplanes missouriensis 431]|uniref:Uncharacterized protein n=1 Tax=Actinoplanes missouriensis (strain ATCC 14538 / DSM 43046 / CBS 188.64 / JCM 3121 / NBRC 102363 / NCIMB 12654 / NRRL B-3342 / UNCC 431) TaxID=512565 RepID=I0HG07_ACTM4|nr:hypothetical protein [Actinoplanes missouriensis]BAL91944.1 hypothetical protein AMIS_67240 [Actinoplanes missouriensis 431]
MHDDDLMMVVIMLLKWRGRELRFGHTDVTDTATAACTNRAPGPFRLTSGYFEPCESRYRRNVQQDHPAVGLGELLYRRAQGDSLTPGEQETIRRNSAGVVRVAALRYAAVFAEGQILANSLLGGERVRGAVNLAAEHNRADKALTARVGRRLTDADSGEAASGPLEALVMRHLAGKTFAKALTGVLQQRQLSPHAIDKPGRDFGDWMAGYGLLAPMPADVSRLLTLPNPDFADHVIASLKAASPLPAHEAITSRWDAVSKRVTRQLREHRELIKSRLEAMPRHRRSRTAAAELREACRLYAVGCALSEIAAHAEKELQIRCFAAYHSNTVQRIRVECLNAAAAEVAQKWPDLAAVVWEACARHRQECPETTSPHPCSGCARGIAAEVQRTTAFVDPAIKIVEPSPLAAEPTPLPMEPAPDPKPSTSASLVDVGAESVELVEWIRRPQADGPPAVWQVILHRLHLRGGWCPIPEITLPLTRDSTPLSLRLDYNGGSRTRRSVEQQVRLRHQAGEWELTGLDWPSDLPPGVILTLKWALAESSVAAKTSTLWPPVRVDGVAFFDRYHSGTVIRELAPGSDQDRDTPDLTNEGWVLRTLRVLGHLRTDGSVIIAEQGLIANCRRLGIPGRRADQLHRVVDRLLQRGLLSRVEGSVDVDGTPHCPPRPGRARVPMLRFQPTPVPLDERSQGPNSTDARARRAHVVQGFVRRLPDGAEASQAQLELYEEAVRQAQVVAGSLPPGHTYVQSHRRKA